LSSGPAQITCFLVIEEGALLASGLLALFYLSTEVVHQFGHALTARLIGHPMSGFRLWWWFTWSEYPPDEPTLPAHVHIIRALGGAAAHGLMFALAYWIFLQTRGAAPWLDYFGILSWLFGLYFFVVSAFVTDGVAFLMMRGWRGTFLELDRRVQSESVE